MSGVCMYGSNEYKYHIAGYRLTCTQCGDPAGCLPKGMVRSPVVVMGNPGRRVPIQCKFNVHMAAFGYFGSHFGHAFSSSTFFLSPPPHYEQFSTASFSSNSAISSYTKGGRRNGSHRKRTANGHLARQESPQQTVRYLESDKQPDCCTHLIWIRVKYSGYESLLPVVTY